MLNGTKLFLFRTCGLDDTCVLCQYCYNADDHIGHQVTVSISQQDCGGVCDCGDQEAWVKQFSCKYHDVNNFDSTPLDPELYQSILDTVETALDYTIDVLCNSHTAIQKFKSADEVRSNEERSRLSEQVYGVSDHESDGKYVLCLWNDQKHSFTDAINVIMMATFKTGAFAEMVSKQIDSYGRGMVSQSSDLDMLMRRKTTMESTGLINTVRSTRDYVREEMCHTIFQWLEDLSKGPVNNNYLILRDILCRALCKPWRYGTEVLRSDHLDHETLLGHEYVHSSFMDIHGSLEGPCIPDLIRRYEENSILSLDGDDEPATSMQVDESSESETPRGKNEAPSFWKDEVSHNDDGQKISARVQYLIFFDIRLWKSLRLILRDLYISVLVSNSDYKLELGHLYAQLYPQIAELYMLADREPECSIISSLSTQLFTSPSIATDLIKYDYFTTFVAALYTFFTSSKIGPPDAVDPNGCISMDSRMLRNKRFGQLFHDLEYMLNRNTKKEKVAGNLNRIQQIADFLLLFQGLSPIIRQTSKHVEYESDIWTSFFNAMPYVLQLAHVIAKGIQDCDAEKGKDTIRAVSKLIINWTGGKYRNRFPESEIREYPTPGIVRLKYDGIEQQVREFRALAFRVEMQRISLHHPLHAYLSWIIEYGKFESAAELRSLLLNHDLQLDDDLSLSFIFDHSFRVLLLLSQIQVGLWVRNGYSVRTQLHLYREITLRELGFRRDIFMAQTALTLDPVHFVSTIITLWGIGFEVDFDIDSSQRVYLIEELLHYMISFLMERTALMGLGEKETLRRYQIKELIQCLFFKDMAFSEMCKVIPDILTTDAMFEELLQEMAIFKPPVGVRDYGVYQLRPEYFDKVDSHYLHFSSTKIEEAETVLKTRISKSSGKPIETIVLEPALEPILSGPFIGLSAFTRTIAFTFLLKQILDFVDVNREENQHDNLFNHLLHLCHIAALDDFNTQNEERSFASYMCEQLTPNLETGSILGYIITLSKTDEFKDRTAKIQRIISLLKSKDPNVMIEFSVRIGANDEISDSETVENIESEAERKKRVGKERQAQILAEFQKRQKLFAQQHADLEDDEDEDENLMDVDTNNNDIDGKDSGEEYKFPAGQCILCRMPDDKNSVFGLVGYAMHSNVYRTVPFNNKGWVYEAFGSQKNLDDDIAVGDIDTGSEAWTRYRAKYRDEHKFGPGFPTEANDRRPIVTSCGHGVHYHCYEDYVKSVVIRAQQLTRNNPEEPQKGEFLCPLCKSINNVFLPVLWKSNTRKVSDYLESNNSFQNFYMKINELTSMGLFDPLSIENLMISGNGLQAQGFKHLQANYANVLLNNALAYIPRDEELEKARLGYIVDNCMNKFAERFYNLHLTGESRYLPVKHNHGISGVLNTLANTISALEISLRGKTNPNPMGGLIVDQIPTQALSTIRVFSELCITLLGAMASSSAGISSSKVDNMIDFDLMGEIYPFKLSDMNFENFVKNALLIAPLGKLEVHHFLRVTYMGTIVNTLLRLVREVNEKSEWASDRIVFELPTVECSNEGMRALQEIIGLVRSLVETRPIPDTYIWSKPAFMKVIYSMLLKSVTPFLRKCAIFVFTVCGAGYDPYDFMGFDKSEPEATKLCEFLMLPKLDEILVQMIQDGSAERQILIDWSRSSFLTLPLISNKIEYPGVIRLLNLPRRLDEFFNLENHSSESVYPELPPDPAVCLFCGASVGLQTALYSNDSRGECHHHMLRCGKDIGIFLLPKRSSILLLKGYQGSFAEGPYLDLHGEADETMR